MCQEGNLDCEKHDELWKQKQWRIEIQQDTYDGVPITVKSRERVADRLRVVAQKQVVRSGEVTEINKIVANIL
jgi:hypothetical protein